MQEDIQPKLARLRLDYKHFPERRSTILLQVWALKQAEKVGKAKDASLQKVLDDVSWEKTVRSSLI